MDGPPNSPMDLDPACSTPNANRIAPSHWGPFELRERVGRGGFGEVYRAWDPSLQREIGLKILLPLPYQAENSYNEILREARTLASVRHPNILPVYGVDRHDGRVGLWTDFVHGKSLAELVRVQGHFGYREASLIGLDVCRALSAVHRAGFLHRDIKAENVMREEGGRILLMDFGLSALGGDQNGVAGTPIYMAPEVLRGEPASVASDIYAVGVLLFFLVTGHFPTEPQPTAVPATPPGQPSQWNPDAVTVTHISASLAGPISTSRSVLDHRPDLPEVFVRVVETAQHPDPLRRFVSAGAISSALSEVLGVLSSDLISSAPAQRSGRRVVAWTALILAVFGGYAAVRAFHLAGPRQAAQENAPAGVNEQFLKADVLLQRYDIHKNVTDAIDLLNGILSRDPNFAPAQAALGRAYFLDYRVSRAQGELDRARAACDRAVELDATLVRPHVTLASIEAAAGHTDLAMQEANQALHLDPRSADAWGAQSTVLDAEGRTDDAIAAAQKAADLDPGYWGWPVMLGNYFYNEGKLHEARDQYLQAASNSPDNANVLVNLGLVASQLGQYAEAQRNLEKSVQTQPSFLAYATLAEVYGSQGQYGQAIEASQKALDLNPTNYIAWGNLGTAYLFQPDRRTKAVDAFRKAVELAEIARKETPEDPILLAALGGYYAFLGQDGLSLPLLRQAVTLAPENPDVLFLAGDGYEVMHRRADSLPLITRSIALGFPLYQLKRSPELVPLFADPKLQQALQAAERKH